MHAGSELLYAVAREGEPRTEGESAVYCHPAMAGRSVDELDLDVSTVSEVYARRLIGDAAALPFLGQRRLVDGQLAGEYSWATGEQVRSEASELGAGLLHLGAAPTGAPCRGYTPRPIGLCARNGHEYFCAEIACTLYGLTLVPIYESFGLEAMAHIVEQCALSTCLAGAGQCALLAELKRRGRCQSLQRVIVLDAAPLSSEARAEIEAVLSLHTYAELRREGAANAQHWPTAQPHDLWLICYTSGAGGPPKGVMLTQRNMLSVLPGVRERAEVGPNDCYLSYLPLAHVLERSAVLAATHFGARIGFASGDVHSLAADAKLLRPTIFASVPRFYVKLCEAANARLGAASLLARTLYRLALNAKLSRLRANGTPTHFLYDALIFRRVRAELGGRLRLMLCGAAPAHPAVLEQVKASFCCPLLEGYGQTEACGMEFSTRAEDPRTGSVGGPFPNVEYKLVSVPKLGYHADAAEPAGELWLRGPGVSPGYYLNEEHSAESFAPGGWLRTGDIARVSGAAARLTIVDRRKSMFKLQQGEYIAPERLESTYKSANAAISELFVHGDGLRASLVAVVVVDRRQLERDGVTAADGEAVKSEVLKLLARTASDARLNPLERIKNVHVETKSFAELGLLTATFKLRRQAASKHYHEVIEGLYRQTSTH